MTARAGLALAAVLLAAPPVVAQEAATAADDTAALAALPPPRVVTTRHVGTFGGTRVAYTARIGETYLKDDKGKPTASIVSTTYLREGPVDPNRPVFFIFNGGPGSGSLWLHMGAWGPKRVDIPDARDDGAPPYPIRDNPNGLLDVADLVFIDPVGTGWSRALPGTDPKTFYGITQDARSVAQFIRIWLNENGRWNAPKYVGGESYGTTRSVAVLRELEGTYNDVALNGVILISTVLDFSANANAPGNEMPYVMNLPSMAAAAWYHNRMGSRPADVASAVAEARAFAIGPYAAALLKGSALPAAERAAIRGQLARFTGLSETYLDQADLRVSPGRFYRELLRDRGLVIGRLDARYTGREYDNAGETAEDDPSFYAIDGGYSTAINAYARGDLKFDIDRDYLSISGLGAQWDWNIGGPRGGFGYTNVAPWLGEAMRKNAGLRVFVAQGWYDFATPFFAAEYALSRTGIPTDGRISWRYYDAGHMMYSRPEDAAKLSQDVRAFIRGR